MKSEKFKDSPLGPIPQDWEVKRLGEIGEPLMCKRVLKHQTSDQGDIPFYKIGTFGKTPDAYISRSLFESLRSKYPFPRKGDCLISAAGTIGRVVVYNGEDAYFQDSNIVWIDNDESVVTNEYLALCYALMKWQSEDGGIISRLYNANLKAQIIVCPPLPEQQRIAEALGEVDKLIESLDEQIEKKRLIAKGVAHDLLSAKKRLPGFKGAWEMLKLGDMGIWLKGQALSKSDVTSTGTYECIHYGELFTKYGPVIQTVVSRTDKEPTISSVSGDILFPSSDVTPEGLGRCSAIMADGVILGGDMIILRLGVTCSPQLVSHVINQNRRMIIAKVTGITVRHITSKALSNIEIPLPPTFAEQQAIADLLGEQDAAIAALEEKREKYARIKEGMMRELLTGKVRMKGG